jgi:hypothetical protein
VLDLLDLVGAVYRIESEVPQRLTNPAKEWKITAPVRDLKFWTAEGGTLLGSCLGFLSRALWTFTFERRQNAEDPVLTRETLIKLSSSTASQVRVQPDEASPPTEDTGDDDRL